MSNKLEDIYRLRETFLVIGLTGRFGNGCRKIGEILNEDTLANFQTPNNTSEIKSNEERKYKIAYSYVKEHWIPFQVILYKDVLTLIITYYPFKQFRQIVDKILNEKKQTNLFENQKDLSPIDEIESGYNQWHGEIRKLGILNKLKSPKQLSLLYNIFYSDQFKGYSKQFHSALAAKSVGDRMLVLQKLTNNLRQTGSISFATKPKSQLFVYTIAETINKLIKAYRDYNPTEEGLARIVIDALRNSLEIRFFKERYSAFYMMAVNASDDAREYNLKERYKEEYLDIKRIDDQEYKSNSGDFFKQDVANCIQISDIHLNNTEAERRVDPEFNPDDLSLRQHLLQYTALMLHPGLITPSREERCMEVAYTAKYNSGCISRQVGAVVTDKYYSIKSIGWNNSAEGQVPCLLRSLDDLKDGSDPKAFSQYETGDVKFRTFAGRFYDNINKDSLGGRNCSFCFKDIKNQLEQEKNQVHTRSLHAEENAFLQIAKYGGVSLREGILFSTASPCELCAKKAYQLGIKTIFYIDPYPGISRSHILGSGTNRPNLILFTGAIGRAYYKLYEPFMAYKEELAILNES